MPASTEQSEVRSDKPRHLVRYDYGMGGLLWWIHAESAAAISESLAGVEVLTDPQSLREAAAQDLKTVDLDGPLPVPLSGMRAERLEQQSRPGFGALVGRDRVHLAWTSRASADGTTRRTLVELGPDGRVRRQVEVRADGSAVRAADAECASTPAFDLYDPQYAAMEVGEAEFEEAWRLSA